MSHEYWMTIGHVTQAARTALIEADCFVADFSAKPPLVAVAIRHQDDLSFIWGPVTQLQVASTGIYLIWRSNSNQNPVYASAADTKLLTYEEWGVEITSSVEQLDSKMLAQECEMTPARVHEIIGGDRLAVVESVGRDPEVSHYPHQIEHLLTDLDEQRPF